MTYYKSEEDFDLTAAHLSKKIAKHPKNVHKFEKFTNQDYDAVCSKDFRSVRYHRQQVYKDEGDSEETLYFSSKKRKSSNEETRVDSMKNDKIDSDLTKFQTSNAKESMLEKADDKLSEPDLPGLEKKS